MTNCSRIVLLWYVGCLIVGCVYNKEIKYIIISILIIILILLLIIKINKCYYKKTKINYSNDYKQKLNEIAETYSYKLSYLYKLKNIKLNDKDISVLVEIKLKENSNTTIEQLWTETEQELKDTIHYLIKDKQNLENTRKKEMDDLENQLKQLRKQSLINNLKQQGKRKKTIIKQEDDLISFV
jgi:Tfp pilus assembly protein PilO